MTAPDDNDSIHIPVYRPPSGRRGPVTHSKRGLLHRLFTKDEPDMDVDCVDEFGRLCSPSGDESARRGWIMSRVTGVLDRVRSLGDGAPRGWWLCLIVSLLASAIYIWRLTADTSGWAHLAGAVMFFLLYGIIGSIVAAAFLCVGVNLFCRFIAMIAPWFEL